MDAVTTLRDLWRHRRAVVGVLALSALAGTLVMAKFSPPLRLESRGYQAGVATTSVLIDTPNSQVAALAPAGAGDLGARADLLSRLMVQGTLKARIAEAAGLHPRALFGRSLAVVDPLDTATPPRGAPVLTTQVLTSDTAQLPLIQIEAQAGDAASAAKLADAAVAGLQGYIDQQAADTQVPDRRRVRISRLGPTQAGTVQRGPSNAVALAVCLVVFSLGCGLILGFAAVVRSWRGTVVAERYPQDESPTPIGVSPLRHAESVSPLQAARPSPLRPADDAPPATDTEPESKSDRHDHLLATPTAAEPKTKAKPRAGGTQRRRRSSAS